MITSSYALGFIIKCGDRTIRFTSDTGWNPAIEDENKQFMSSKQIEKIDILIPHLGSIEDSEFRFDFGKTIEENIADKIFYEQHLGILGCICMIQKYKPELVVFSEFGEELKAIRKDIVGRIAEAMKVISIPGDIGLDISLNDLTVYCNKKGAFEDKEAIEVYEVKDDLVYVSSNSFTVGERANKQKAVDEMPRKYFLV